MLEANITGWTPGEVKVVNAIKNTVRWVNDRNDQLADIGLLLLRLGIGLTMAFAHGWGKIAKLFTESPVKFPDPIGVGSFMSLLLAGSAEFFAALFIAAGFLTRLSAIPLAFTMIVAAFVIHADDPWRKQEFAFIYFIPCLALIFTGPGKYSVDSWIMTKLKG